MGCSTHEEKSCSYVMGQKCFQISLPHCKIEHEKTCEMVPKCHTEYRQLCDVIPKEECKIWDEQVCKNATVTRCVHTWDKTCTKVQDDVCTEKWDKTCTKVWDDVCTTKKSDKDIGFAKLFKKNFEDDADDGFKVKRSVK